MKLPLPLPSFDPNKSPKKDETGQRLAAPKILNSSFRIKTLKKKENLNIQWLNQLSKHKEEKDIKNAVNLLEKNRRKEYRKSIKHISKKLEEELYIKPGTSAKMGKIRKFLVDKKFINKKEKMKITEANIVQKWQELVGSDPEIDEETESEDLF